MSLRARIIFLIILVILGIMFITPSIQWYFVIPEDAKATAMGSLPQIKTYAQTAALREYEKINEFVNNPSSKLAEAYGGFLKKVFEEKGQVDPAAFRTAVEGLYRDDILSTKILKESTLQLGLDLQGGLYVSIFCDFDALEKQIAATTKEGGGAAAPIDKEKYKKEIVEQLLARLDQFGTTEPTIRQQLGSDNIIIELPGAADPERIKKVILGKGFLNFHLVDEEAWNAFNDYYRSHPGYLPEFDVAGKVILPADVSIKAGTMVVGIYKKDKYGMDELTNYIALQGDASLSGEAIKDAHVDRNTQNNRVEVTFILGDYLEGKNTVSGPDRFGDLTEKNTGRLIAVVLDNKVMSYARINEKIPNGQVRVTGDFTTKDGEDLAKVLRTGSLPVPLEIRNTSSVGASAGEDTIAKGLTGAIIGAILVLAFMLIYYKGAGMFAVVALLFNVFFLLAILAVTRFTLSLTSIAGIILTIGMSVDANVLIYERMKEEFRLGKTSKAAVKAGFDRAFWTILDANVTTFIAMIVLALFTKGSIQGFAFTTCVGIVTSFFTAIFVSRILFDFTTDVLKLNKLSISWRRLQ